MEAFEILVIIVSVVLSLFLVLTIIVLLYVLRVLKHIEYLTKRAEHIADNMDKVGSFFKKTAGPVALGKLIANIVDLLKKDKGDDNVKK